MKINKDFSVGYSPERINPADPKHTFENIKKLSQQVIQLHLKKVKQVYSDVVRQVYILLAQSK